MAERQIKRNSRGQIVSYEIAAINDPTVATPEYGKFLLQGVNEEGTLIEKYSDGSFNEEINTDITLELVTSDTSIDTQIVLNEIITTQDQRDSGGSVGQGGSGNQGGSGGQGGSGNQGGSGGQGGSGNQGGSGGQGGSSTTDPLFPFGVPGNSLGEIRPFFNPNGSFTLTYRWTQTSAGTLWQQL